MPLKLATARAREIEKAIQPIVKLYSPEEILTVLASELTMRATIGPEVEVAQWVQKLADRIEARGD